MIVKRLLGAVAVAAVMLVSAGVVFPAEQAPVQEKAQTKKQEQIYGSQLMSPKERDEYRAKMHAAKTPEEREQIRKEHHALMQKRAKAKGITLPDEPPARGGGMGPGGNR